MDTTVLRTESSYHIPSSWSPAKTELTQISMSNEILFHFRGVRRCGYIEG